MELTASVTVYQPEGPCHKCKVTKMGLDAEGVPFTAVTADEETIEKFKAEGHMTFPIVVATFGDNVTWTWSDYRRDNIAKLVELL